MRIPFSVPTVSDATKLGLAKTCSPPLTGEALYELLFQNVLTDNFANFDLWTKVGHKGTFTTVPLTARAAAPTVSDDACVRKDYGAGFFGDFVHDFDLILQSVPNAAYVIAWAMDSNACRTVADMLADNTGFGVLWNKTTTNHIITLWNFVDDTNITYDVGNATQPQTLYCRIERAGTAATLTFYTTAARTSEVTHIHLTVANTTHRYLYALGLAESGSGTASWSTANLALSAGGAAVDFNDALWLILTASETPNIALAAGVVTLTGNGSWAQNGLFLTPALNRAEGYLEFKILGASWSGAGNLGLGWDAATPWLPNTDNLFSHFYPNGSALYVRCANLISVYQGFTVGTYYTIRVYLRKSSQAAWCKYLWTIQGGTEYLVETVLCSAEVPAKAADAKIFAFAQRQQIASTMSVKEFRAYFNYATDGPTLTYVADAGAGKLFQGLVFANLAAVGSWATTNVTFAYDFSDSATPSFSAEKTLAQLNALAALTTNKRYIHLRVTVNSDGATQQYAGELNADDGTTAVFVLPTAGTIIPGTTINTIAGTADLPAIGNVVPPDTLLGVTGEYVPLNIAARYAIVSPRDVSGNEKARFKAGDTIYFDGLINLNQVLADAAVTVEFYPATGGTPVVVMDAVEYSFSKDTGVTIATINGGNKPSQALTAYPVGTYHIDLDIAHASLPGGHIFGTSEFTVSDEPATTAVAADDTTGDVAGGIALSSILPPRGTSDKIYSAAEEIARNTITAVKVALAWAYKALGVDCVGEFVGGGGGTPAPGLHVVDNHDGTVTLIFTGTAGATFKLYRKGFSETTWTALYSGASTSYVNAAVTLERWYEYLLLEVIDGNYSLPSAPVPLFATANASREGTILLAVEALVQALAWTGWATAQVDRFFTPEKALAMKMPRCCVCPGLNAPDVQAFTNVSDTHVYPVRVYLLDRVTTNYNDALVLKAEQLKGLFRQERILSGITGVYKVEVKPLPVAAAADVDASIHVTGVDLLVYAEEDRQ